MTRRPPIAHRGPWILTIDIGTSSVRAGWIDARGRPLAPDVARAACTWRATPDGGMEADADAMLGWCADVIDQALLTARAAGIEPAGVAVAAFWHGLVGIGAGGAAITPLYGWGDRRARAAADALRARVDEGVVHQRTGCFVHEVYPAARLVWLREAGADSLPPASTWAGIGELLALRWFGARRTSASMASGTGLMDLRRCAWDGAMLEAVGVSEDVLPPIRDDALRGLVPQMARRWPELASIPWTPALGDGACASLGLGGAGRRIGLTVGTSAALRVLRDEAEPVVPPGLWCYRLDARRTVTGRALSNGGSVYAWLRRTLRLPSEEELEAALAALPPASHGLRVVPRLLPERPPRPAGFATGVMAGLTAGTQPVEIARAWLEAAAFAMGDALDAVEAAFGPADEVVAGGGALHASPAWARIVADALGRPLRLSPHAESTLRGVALLALERLGALDDAAAFAAAGDAEARADADEGDRLEPDAAVHEVYRAARAEARSLG